MTTSSQPPPSSLNLPEPVYGHPNHVPSSPRRPHSPLRNDFIPRRNSHDSQSGDDNDEDDDDSDDDDDANRTWVRSQSPASVTQFAANIAQRVGSFISPAPGSRALPSDAELEAESQRERDRSRREAERILTQEAEERRAMEERVLAMMNSSPQSLPPPRGRSQTLPNPPSPATSAKEAVTGWWAAAKSRITPTKDKEPLTPAQQVIEEARTREKDKKHTKSTDWPASGSGKYGDPAYLNLKIPPWWTTAPIPINLSPISLQRGTSPGGSPAREQPPLYASFTPSGTLDVPGTLLVIAKRFEKLERWTVSHVRALEDRMGDVERWLVTKEQDKGQGHETHDITELQSRIGELGREMAHFATSPAVLSTNTAAHESHVLNTAPHTESSIVSTHQSSISTTSSTGSISSDTSTPVIGKGICQRHVAFPHSQPVSPRALLLPASGHQKPHRGAALDFHILPGDYASPSDVISPTHTPASSPPAGTRPTSMVISGLPPISSPLELPTSMSPPSRTMSPTPSGLPPPSLHSARMGSVSPTPISGSRKRYTVALGGPIIAPAEAEYEPEKEKAYFSSAIESSDDDDDFDAETVGKKAASRAAAAAKLAGGEDAGSGQATASPRARAQSMYGGFTGVASMQINQASKHRLGSQSIDFGSNKYH
ncbi:hypothetical protein BU15DRAFT_90208 [Melanogaster broomeanus]|nr:hypothetical protein BU15DRAFT_90208 [Melanogaster broomeanus]